MQKRRRRLADRGASSSASNLFAHRLRYVVESEDLETLSLVRLDVLTHSLLDPDRSRRAVLRGKVAACLAADEPSRHLDLGRVAHEEHAGVVVHEISDQTQHTVTVDRFFFFFLVLYFFLYIFFISISSHTTTLFNHRQNKKKIKIKVQKYDYFILYE